jgi:hypothetical protein
MEYTIRGTVWYAESDDIFWEPLPEHEPQFFSESFYDGPQDSELFELPQEDPTRLGVLQCSICLREPSVDPVVLDCAHEFCVRCIYAWVRITPRCPLCRASIPPSQIHGSPFF